MKPVKQTIFGERTGNCFAACIASILEVPLDTVPNFCATSVTPEGQDWLMAANQWLAGKGLALLDVDIQPDGSLGRINALSDGAYCIISGKSPRGEFSHATVGRYRLDNKSVTHWLDFVHDPHPSNEFLAGPATQLTFFVSLNPAASQKGGA